MRLHDRDAMTGSTGRRPPPSTVRHGWRRRRWVLPGLLVLAAVLVACAAGPNEAAGPDQAGFLLGLWHGLITPVTFIVSLFNDDVSVYEVVNNGNWYDFGFMLGVSTIFSGTAGSARSASRRRS